MAEVLAGRLGVAVYAWRRLVRYSETRKQLMILDDPKFGFVRPRDLDIDDFKRILFTDQDSHRNYCLILLVKIYWVSSESVAPVSDPANLTTPKGYWLLATPITFLTATTIVSSNMWLS